MRGRLPVAASLADLRGHPGHRSPAPPASPPIATAPPRPPKGMSRGARKVWRRTIAPGIAAGLIHPTLDQAVAFVFCSYRAELSELDAQIREHPGAEIGLDPALLRTMRRRDAAADKLLRYASELGLSPTSRLRLGHRGDAAPKTSAEDVRRRLRAMSTVEELPKKTEPTAKAPSKTIH